MKIVADENIPAAERLFSYFGEVELLPGRSLTASQIKKADILLVRSVTQVNRELLEGSQVQFVGTCTIGVDHLDQEYLTQAGIVYSNAPGCNANGVVQYDLAALTHLDKAWMSKSIGIVGCGNVGRRLYKAVSALGVSVKVYDPFLDDLNLPLCSLEEVLNNQIVCMHAPYTIDGPFPSRHMLNKNVFKQLPEKAILLNAGRGGTIDNHALLEHMRAGANLRLVLDVWEGEPDICLELLKYTELATAHIAGYGYEGKLNGSSMIFESLLNHLNDTDGASRRMVRHSEALAHCKEVMDELKGDNDELHCETIEQAIADSYDIVADDRRFRSMIRSAQMSSSTTVALEFDRYRKTYPIRRELSHFKIVTNEINLKQLACRLGFKCDGGAQ